LCELLREVVGAEAKGTDRRTLPSLRRKPALLR
jgi:hypothetical protein